LVFTPDTSNFTVKDVMSIPFNLSINVTNDFTIGEEPKQINVTLNYLNIFNEIKKMPDTGENSDLLKIDDNTKNAVG
jgi:hypothetical protein